MDFFTLHSTPTIKPLSMSNLNIAVTEAGEVQKIIHDPYPIFQFL